MPKLAGISHIDLTVSDVARSEAFYTHVLGFTRRDAVRRPFFVGVVLGRDDLGLTLGLNWCEAGDGSRFDEMRTGLDHLSFEVPSDAELSEWEAVFREHGVAFTPPVETPKGSIVVFRDPDNIQLELFVTKPEG